MPKTGKTLTSINPLILAWARRTAGISLEEVGERIGKEPSVIEAWESGVLTPTYVQLEKLAYEVYKRPLAVFFFPAPPEEVTPEQAFRSIPHYDISKMHSHSRFLIREARAFQISIKELAENKNPAESAIFKRIKLSVSDNIKNAAAQVTTFLGESAVRSVRKSRTKEEALKSFREIIEDYGIFIFKDSFKEKALWGFCLFDEEFPVIYLNNGTSSSKQIFTLIHELAHILLHINGITSNHIGNTTYSNDSNYKVERFCDEFAVEFLLPESEFRRMTVSKTVDYKFIGDLAIFFKVSHEVIARRFWELKLIEYHLFESFIQRIKEEEKKYEKKLLNDKNNKENNTQKKPLYYPTLVTYLGKSYLKLAFSKYYEGKISIEQLSNQLGVKPSSIDGIESQMVKWRYI